MKILFMFIYLTFAFLLIGFAIANILKKHIKVTFYEKYAIGLNVVLITSLILFHLGTFNYFNFIFHLIILISILINIFYINVSNLIKRQGNINILILILFIFTISFYSYIPVSNFIFYIGDAGHYVNSANKMVLTGRGLGGFFPLNQSWLGVFSAIFGREYTSYGALYISTIIPISFFYLIKQIYHDTKVALFSFVLIGFNILSIWFARLPFSENLMSYLNINILLFYIKFFKEKNSRLKLYYLILTGCFFTLACLTRVTGLIWMMALSCNYYYNLLFVKKDEKYQFILIVIAFLGYIYSVYFALNFGANYYINWQLKGYIPFINSKEKVYFLHLIWALILLLPFFVVRNKKFKKFKLLYIYIKRRHFVATISMYLIFTLLISVIIKDLNNISFVNLIYNLKNLIVQDIYYLKSFFSYGSLLIFPLGFIIFSKKYNPFKKNSLSLLWLFSIFFVILYYIRVVYTRNHDLYLYWFRYFYSEVFLIYAIMISSSFIIYKKNIYYKFILIVFFVVYLTTSSFWIQINYNVNYLNNAFEVIENINKSIYEKDSVIFLESRYYRKWLFPNFRHCILYPLKFSYNLNIEDNDVYNSAFSEDSSINKSKILHFLQKGKTVYILIISDSDKDYYNEIEQKFMNSGINLKHIESFNSVITIKKHYWRNIFHKKMELYPIYVSIYKLKKLVILPEKYSFKKGFYKDNNWTNGNGIINNINLPLHSKNKYIIVNTYGLNPFKNNLEKLNLSIYVNGKKLKYVKKVKDSYYFKINNNDIKEIKKINIISSTFVPKELGINNDTRKLGIDVHSITIE